MSKVKYSKSRIITQTKSKSLKYMKPMAPGTVLTVTDVIENVYPGVNGAPDTMNDVIICKDADGGIVKVPVKEFTGMTVLGDTPHYSQEANEDSIELPKTITISKSEDRKNGDKLVFPIYSYTGVNDFLSNNLDYEGLMATELENPNPFSPVQNYTVELAH
tara:strand:- start:909 stop:1391 length:483 start_codon:yes stop_codon:yes gene_type:complete